MLDFENLQEIHLEHFFSTEIQHLKSIHIAFGSQSKNFDTSLLNMDNIQPYPNTREMLIYYDGCFYYDDHYILYIMKKFPNLESLQLVGRPQSCRRKPRYAFPTIDCLLQFLVYLSKMKKHSRATMVTNNFTTQLVKKFLSYVIDQQTAYYKNTNISLDILFNFKKLEEEHRHSPDTTEYITEYITIQNQKAGYENCNENKCILSVVYNIFQETTFQSHLQLFREVGNMNITRLQITNNKSITTIPVVLDEIFIQFPNLENLTISDVPNFIWNKEESLVEETINSTIKYMEYMHCTLTKDMFPMISRLCQNLKTLNLNNCQYTNNNEDKIISRYFPIFMPSMSLEELIINLDNTEEFQYKKVFIRLITNNKKTRYCKITAETDSPIVNIPEQDCKEAHYNMCLHDEEYSVFDIHCEAVVKLIVHSEGFDEYNPSYELKEYIEQDL